TGARLVKAGAGTLTLTGNNSAFTGPIQVSAGGGVLVASGNPNALGSAAAGTTVLAGGQLALQNLTGPLAEPLTLNGTGVSAGGALRNLAGVNVVSGPVVLAADASVGVAVTVDQLILNGGMGGVGTAGLTKVGPGILRLNSPGSYAGVTAVAAGTLVVTSATALGVADGTAATGTTVAAGAALVVDGVSVGAEALTVGDGTGAGEFNFRSTAAWAGPVTLANTLTTGIGTSASDALTLTGAIGGAGSLTKTGDGRLTLGGAAANTYGGVTTADDGFLFLAKAGGAVAIPAAGLVVTGTAFVQYQQGEQIADTAPVRVTNGTVLDLGTFSDTIGPLTLGATTGSDAAFVTTTGAGTLRLNGNVTREVSAAAPGAAQIIGRLDLNGATRTVTVADSTALVELFIPAAVVNSGGGAAGLTKAGAGTLQLSNSTVNTYTGATTVLGGTLELNKSAAGATAVPGALVVGAGAAVESFAANLIADTAQVTVGAGATFYLNGDPETVAGLSVSGGTVTIAGSGVLTVGGPVTLQNATVSSGTLALGGGVTVLAGGATTVTSRIDLAGTTRTFDVADAGAGDDLIIGNVILNSGGGAAGLTKTGAGTLTLGVANSYTGTTTVTAGVLRVVGSVATSPVALAGGTLTGSGTVGVVTATGGTLTPGLAGPTVILTTSGVVLGAGSTFAPVISSVGGGIADLLRVNGTVNLTGATLNPTLIGTPPTGTLSFLLIANDGTDAVVGTFAGLPQGATLTLGGVPFAVQYNDNDGNDVVLVPTVSPPPPPPPGTPGPVRPVAVGGATDGSVRLVTAAGLNVTVSPFGNTGTATRTAVADVDGDGTADVVAVTGPGTPLRVAVLSGATGQFLVQPFDPFGGDFTGGGYVAAADLDRDGRAEFVVTPDQGGGPRVSIFGRAADGTRTTRAN
ncbi:autotransporter-associated beta strand repeat-containing protein, partial [bacterium]|nr:autotransporter-associated beta strand repeat-containing protein [bacterium]